MSTTSVSSPIKSFKDLVESTEWRSILQLLQETGRQIMVAEGEAFAGRYSAVVLNSKGFQLESGKAGMTAAFTGGSHESHTPLDPAEVAEKAIYFSGPLSDDPVDTPTPTEEEIVAKLMQNIDELRQKQPSPKEKEFLMRILRRVADMQTEIPLRFATNIAFRFEVPSDFTEQEFNNVGRELSRRAWQWEQIGKRGESRWSFILIQI